MSEGRATMRLVQAMAVATRAHADQRRKGSRQEPYINHLVEVAELVAEATAGEDVELIMGALLHDTLEDTELDRTTLATLFGERVARLVDENSDDMSLPKAERKRQRLAHAAGKSDGARIIKLADMTSNVRATATAPPAGWPAEWCHGYINSCRELHDAIAGTNSWLEQQFAAAVEAAEAVIRERGGELAQGGKLDAVLSASAGQPVHLIYLANTGNRPGDELDRQRLIEIMTERFPSFTVQEATGVFDGAARPVVMVRVRSDSSDAIVAVAQRLCVDLEQRFVGIETAGRYLRIYADDTA